MRDEAGLGSIASLEARAFKIPTSSPEADGTFAWSSTTIIVVFARSGAAVGLGYTYSDASIVALIEGALAAAVRGRDASDPQGAWRAMTRAVRNMGRPGLAATAVSAVDVALWDLKAKLCALPLASLLGRFRAEVEIYGSGGFTSYDDKTLQAQLSGWVEEAGCRAVKMKVGSDPSRDPHRVRTAKAAIGDAALFVDANGAYARREALSLAETFAGEADVRWFEEPVSSDDLEGLAFLRGRLPPAMDLAAGEYGYTPGYFRTMLAAGAVDVQQADATRCGGVTGFLMAGALCEAFHTDLSAHCAPALHRHLGCAVPRFRNLEWFHDHVLIERRLFDGAPEPKDGRIRPDPSRPGLGLEFRPEDAAPFRI